MLNMLFRYLSVFHVQDDIDIFLINGKKFMKKVWLEIWRAVVEQKEFRFLFCTQILVFLCFLLMVIYLIK